MLGQGSRARPHGGQGGHGCARASPELLGWILPVWPDGANASLEELESPKGQPLEGGSSPMRRLDLLQSFRDFSDRLVYIRPLDRGHRNAEMLDLFQDVFLR